MSEIRPPARFVELRLGECFHARASSFYNVGRDAEGKHLLDHVWVNLDAIAYAHLPQDGETGEWLEVHMGNGDILYCEGGLDELLKTSTDTDVNESDSSDNLPCSSPGETVS